MEAVSGPKTPSQVLSGTNTRTFQAFDFRGYIKRFQQRWWISDLARCDTSLRGLLQTNMQARKLSRATQTFAPVQLHGFTRAAAFVSDLFVCSLARLCVCLLACLLSFFLSFLFVFFLSSLDALDFGRLADWQTDWPIYFLAGFPYCSFFASSFFFV